MEESTRKRKKNSSLRISEKNKRKKPPAGIPDVQKAGQEGGQLW